VAREKAQFIIRGHREPSEHDARNQGAGPRQIFSVVFAPQGNLLASACFQDERILLWDVNTGKVVRSFEASLGMLAVAFSPDGKMLAAGGSDQTIRCWDVSTGRSLGNLPVGLQVHCLAFSPVGKVLAAGGTPGNGAGGRVGSRLRVWAVATWREVWQVQATASASVNALAFTPDGRTLATASYDNLVRLWDVATGQERNAPAGHHHAITAMALSPNGQLVVTGDAQGALCVWEVAAGRPLCHLAGHSGPVLGLAFFADGKQVIGLGGSGDDSFRVWDVMKGEERRRFKLPPEAVPGMYFLALTPDGRSIALPTGGLLDVAAGQVRGSVAKAIRLYRGCFSPDGKLFAAAAEDRTVRVREVATGRELHRLKGHGAVLRAVVFSPDGKLLASAGDDRRIMLWDVASGHFLGSMSGHGSPIWSLSFSPDGRTLASASGDFFHLEDWSVQLWEVASQKERLRLLGHQGGVTALGFTPDGRRLLSSSRDTTVLVWDVSEAAASSMDVPPLRANQ
jgi:WD40 repeat protein